MSDQDVIRRILFCNSDARAQYVCLNESLQAAMTYHHDPYPVRCLLAQLAVMAVLLADALKESGGVTLQIRSEGPVTRLMAECTAQRQIRVLANCSDDTAGGRAIASLLAAGALVMTVSPQRGQRYQTVIALQGGSLAASFNSYFAQSEQVSSRLWLATNGASAVGLLLQALPPQLHREQSVRDHYWQQMIDAGNRATTDQLLRLSPQALLAQLFPDGQYQLFAAQPVVFGCSCSHQRISGILAGFAASELHEMLCERGSIDVHCQFCNQRYLFDRHDVTALTAHQSAPQAGTAHPSGEKPL